MNIRTSYTVKWLWSSMVFMGKCLFDKSISNVSLSLSLLIRELATSITNEMSRQMAYVD